MAALAMYIFDDLKEVFEKKVLTTYLQKIKIISNIHHMHLYLNLHVCQFLPTSGAP